MTASSVITKRTCVTCGKTKLATDYRVMSSGWSKICNACHERSVKTARANLYEKRCTRCGTTKPINDFGPHPRAKDGYQPWCFNCYRDHFQLLRWKKVQTKPAPTPTVVTTPEAVVTTPGPEAAIKEQLNIIFNAISRIEALLEG